MSVTIVHGFAVPSIRHEAAGSKEVVFLSLAGPIILREEPSFVSKLGVAVNVILD